MSQRSGDRINRDEMPFVAPGRKLSIWAPFRWMRLGFADLPDLGTWFGALIIVVIGYYTLQRARGRARRDALRVPGGRRRLRRAAARVPGRRHVAVRGRAERRARPRA